MASLTEFEKSYSHVLLYPPQPIAVVDLDQRKANFSSRMYGFRNFMNGLISNTLHLPLSSSITLPHSNHASIHVVFCSSNHKSRMVSYVFPRRGYPTGGEHTHMSELERIFVLGPVGTGAEQRRTRRCVHLVHARESTQIQGHRAA